MSACLDCGGSECICSFRRYVSHLQAENTRLWTVVEAVRRAMPYMSGAVPKSRTHPIRDALAALDKWREALDTPEPTG